MTINTIAEENQLRPLYVRIPNALHSYLDALKDRTGISKSDAITLILLAAQNVVDSSILRDMFDRYMLNGDSKEIDIASIIADQITAA